MLRPPSHQSIARRYGALAAVVGLTLFCAVSLSSVSPAGVAGTSAGMGEVALVEANLDEHMPATETEISTIIAAKKGKGPCASVCAGKSCEACASPCEKDQSGRECSTCRDTHPMCAPCFVCIRHGSTDTALSSRLSLSQNLATKADSSQFMEALQQKSYRRRFSDARRRFSDSRRRWINLRRRFSDARRRFSDSRRRRALVIRRRRFEKVRAVYTSGYALQTSGKCKWPIIHAADCAAASRALRLPDSRETDDGHNGVNFHPKGCYYTQCTSRTRTH